ncbi:hypothetical protein HY642_05235 [Candidatus Woesearchaeota archaeon]|nr:hypothetical protein [Candidatus Woesearchaeota archaeon]
MRVRYQQRCVLCKKNLVQMTWGVRIAICAPCQMKEISQPISDKAMKKFFKIDDSLYEQSAFLRSVKSGYLRFGSISPKQKDAFQKVVAELSGATPAKEEKLPEFSMA